MNNWVNLALAAVGDDDVLAGLSALGSDGLHRLHDIHPLADSPEHHVLSIQPLGLDGAQEELRPVGVGSCVGHGEDAGSGVFLLEVLVGELLSVDRLPAGTIPPREITTLQHEVGNHTVEFAAFKVERHPSLADSLLSGAQSSKVFSGLGRDIRIQLHNDPTRRLSPDGYIEKTLRTGHVCCLS